MQIHQLKPRTHPKQARRVGRGDKTAGRGTKGQRSRAGAKPRPSLRDLLQKLPKRRGYRFRSYRTKPAAVALAEVTRAFRAGELVDPAALLKKGLIRRMGSKMSAVKVLGSGAAKKRLIFQGVLCSRKARQAVEAAGGSVE